MGTFGRALFGALLIAFAGMAQVSQAKDPYVYAPGGLALSGYDPVSYFSESGPVPGRPEYSLIWRGALWRFASADSLMVFEMNPTAFAPQFGGYCTYSVANGSNSTSQPDAWLIVGGRLYLMHNIAMVETFRPEMPDLITAARQHWPEVLDQD